MSQVGHTLSCSITTVYNLQEPSICFFINSGSETSTIFAFKGYGSDLRKSCCLVCEAGVSAHHLFIRNDVDICITKVGDWLYGGQQQLRWSGLGR